MHSSHTGASSPQPIEIGDRFLLSFDEPGIGTSQQTGRLQDLKNGALCIDVDPDCRPAHGTPLRVSSLRNDISGGGAQLFMRYLPTSERLRLDASAPDSFIEEWALRRISRLKKPARSTSIFTDPLQEACTRLRAEFENIECRVVKNSVHSSGERGTIHPLALAFLRPHEGCFRLVSFLERQSLQRGIESPTPSIATAAVFHPP